MLCSKCSHQLKNDAKFCNKCGAQQQAATPPPVPNVSPIFSSKLDPVASNKTKKKVTNSDILEKKVIIGILAALIIIPLLYFAVGSQGYIEAEYGVRTTSSRTTQQTIKPKANLLKPSTWFSNDYVIDGGITTETTSTLYSISFNLDGSYSIRNIGNAPEIVKKLTQTGTYRKFGRRITFKTEAGNMIRHSVKMSPEGMVIDGLSLERIHR